jgi:hypothetical protein
MAVQIGASVGRTRVPGTMRFNPGSATYVRAIKTQMDQISMRLEKTIKNIKDVTPEAVIYGLQPILELSQQYVPVDTGDLKRSGFIEARKTTTGTRAVIGYAKNGVPNYAAWVHEMMHIPHAKGKSAKFLERAVNERIHILKPRIVDYLKQKAGLGSQW